jgi:hypothetical protein
MERIEKGTVKGTEIVRLLFDKRDSERKHGANKNKTSLHYDYRAHRGVKFDHQLGSYSTHTRKKQKNIHGREK